LEKPDPIAVLISASPTSLRNYELQDIRTGGTVPIVQDQSPEGAAVVAIRHESVERVIQAMHAKLEEPLGLTSMAKIAYLSRFHFNRTFRRVTGIPPTRFLYALRIASARRLLLHTQMHVIDICYEVGYNSLGTFTRRFTELLGVSPMRFRLMARSSKNRTIDPTDAIKTMQAPAPAATSRRITGRIDAPTEFRGLILIGLFDSAIPQGNPRACAILNEPGSFEIASPPDGDYHLFALALNLTADLLTIFDCEPALRCGGQQISIMSNMIQGETNLHLRPRIVTDPPILLTIPLLLRQIGGDQPLRAATASSSARQSR
jgi:AraC family transcriptional regulator